jgi:hypothetical protein
MNERDEQADFVEPHPRARRMLAAVLVLLVGSGLIVVAAREPLLMHLRSLPACDLLAWLRAFLLGAAVLAAIAAAGLAAMGWMVLRDGQAPRPGALVLRRTRVVRGAAARAIGSTILLLALCLAGIAIGLLAKIPVALAQLSGAARCTLGT